MQCREVTGATLRKWKCWLSGVVWEAAHAKLSEMHEAKITQQDLKKRLNAWPSKTYVGQAQLLYLGHLARLPPDRPERLALFGCLVVEPNFLTGKRGTRTCHILDHMLTDNIRTVHAPGKNW